MLAGFADELIFNRPLAPTKPSSAWSKEEQAAQQAAENAFARALGALQAGQRNVDGDVLWERFKANRVKHRSATDLWNTAATVSWWSADDSLFAVVAEYHAITMQAAADQSVVLEDSTVGQMQAELSAAAGWRDKSAFGSTFGSLKTALIVGAVLMGALLIYKGVK